MIKEKIENPELQRLIALKCGRVSFDDVTDEEIEKIFDITLNARLINGKESGISLDVLRSLKGLKRLKLSNYTISQEFLDIMFKELELDSISFSGVEFEDVSFEKYERLPRKIDFVSCLNMPKKYPRVSEVIASGVEMSLDSIDLSSTRKIIIHESALRDAHDLVELQELESVDLDGSRLFDAEGTIIDDIQVSQKTRYTHKNRYIPYEERLF